jgi:uncharacterized RDD family membrane protein YckC
MDAREPDRRGLVSGEGVTIELSRAGLGSRTIAALIDIAVQFVALVIALLVDGTLTGDDDIITAVVIVEVVLILGGYPVLFEWLGRGRTLGKLAMGLRVVRDDGGPIGLRQALVRGISALILEKPGLFFPVGTAIGMIVLAMSPASKRIGDLMAGTFVVNERVGSRASALAPPPLPVPYGLEGWAASLDLTRLDDQLALGVRQFVMRANELSPGARDVLGNDLRDRLLAVIAPLPPYPLATSTILMTVLAERRRRAEDASGSAAWQLHRQFRPPA